MLSLIAKKPQKNFFIFNQLNPVITEDTGNKVLIKELPVEESGSCTTINHSSPSLVKSVTTIKKKEDLEDYSGKSCKGEKSCVNSLCMSRPESRSMRVPTIDVQSLQEKLEKLEQSVAAMRKRRIGIVSGTKEFQRFLNELTPIC